MDVRVLDIPSPQEAKKQVAAVGADPYAVALLASKAVLRTVKLAAIDNRAASLLKQEALSVGADAAVSRAVGGFERGVSDVLVMATLRQWEKLLPKMSLQPFGLKPLAQKIRNALSHYDTRCFTVRCRRKKLVLDDGHPAVMGIVNVTPDSFSNGGVHFDTGRAVEAALEMEAAGAAIIDIGGESTRPGAARVGAAEEKKRILPVIKALALQLKIPISVDTYKPAVGAAALEAGAVILNDISGLTTEHGRMAKVAAHYGAAVIIMHMQGKPRTMQRHPAYRDVVADVADFLQKRVRFALDCGVTKDRIILDPGIGFGKTLEHNCTLLRRLDEFRALGYPILIGLSRKNFIGRITGTVVPAERLAGSLAGAVASYRRGAGIVRVHDVRETVQALAVLREISRTEWN